MKFLEKPVSWLLAIALVALIALANWAVFQRYMVGRPLHFGEELSAFLFIWIVMLGAILAEKDNSHLTISILVDALPAGIARVIALVVAVISMGVLAYAAWLGWNLADSSHSRLTQILRIPMFWTYVAFPVGCLGILAFLVHRVIGELRGGRNG